MKNVSRKMLQGLQPISRDHGIALVCAHYGRKAVRGSDVERLVFAEQMNAYCKTDIRPNLEDEQWILSPLIGDVNLRGEFHRRHRAINELSLQLSNLDVSETPGLGLIARVANALDDYVRWEENTLFPRIAEGIANVDSSHLSKMTTEMEEKRKRPTQRLHHSIALH